MEQFEQFQAWDYQVIVDASPDQICDLGSRGWEMVGLAAYDIGGTRLTGERYVVHIQYVFKRPKIDQSKAPLLRKCPHCAESIKSEASVCRYCGHNVPRDPAYQALLDAQAADERDRLAFAASLRTESMRPESAEVMREYGIEFDDVRLFVFNGKGYENLDAAIQAARRHKVIYG